METFCHAADWQQVWNGNADDFAECAESVGSSAIPLLYLLAVGTFYLIRLKSAAPTPRVLLHTCEQFGGADGDDNTANDAAAALSAPTSPPQYPRGGGGGGAMVRSGGGGGAGGDYYDAFAAADLNRSPPIQSTRAAAAVNGRPHQRLGSADSGASGVDADLHRYITSAAPPPAIGTHNHLQNPTPDAQHQSPGGHSGADSKQVSGVDTDVLDLSGGRPNGAGANSVRPASSATVRSDRSSRGGSRRPGAHRHSGASVGLATGDSAAQLVSSGMRHGIVSRAWALSDTLVFCVSLGLAVLPLVVLLLRYFDHALRRPHPYQLLSAVFLAISWTYACVLHVVKSSKGLRTTWHMRGFWFVATLCATFRLRSEILRVERDEAGYDFYFYLCVCVYPLYWLALCGGTLWDGGSPFAASALSPAIRITAAANSAAGNANANANASGAASGATSRALNSFVAAARPPTALSVGGGAAALAPVAANGAVPAGVGVPPAAALSSSDAGAATYARSSIAGAAATWFRERMRRGQSQPTAAPVVSVARDQYSPLPDNDARDEQGGGGQSPAAVAAAQRCDACDAEHMSSESRAGCLSRVTFWWMGTLMRAGYDGRLGVSAALLLQQQRAAAMGMISPAAGAGGASKSPLHHTNPNALPVSSPLDTLNIVDKSFYVDTAFQDRWAQEEARDGSSLTRALFSAFGSSFALAGVYKLLYDGVLFVSPQLLNAITNYLLPSSDNPDSYGLYFVAGMAGAQLVQSLLLQQYFHECFRFGMHVRSALVTAVYRKSLLMSVSARSAASARHGVSDIVNLMSVDAVVVADLFPYLHIVWSAPFQIAVSIYFLWQLMGASVLVGVAVMLMCLIPANWLLARRVKLVQAALQRTKEQRIKITHEVLANMRLVKTYAWEDTFRERITRLRDTELQELQRYLYLFVSMSMLWRVIPILVSLSTFATFVSTDGELTAARAFTALALFNILQYPLAMFPRVLNNVVDARSALTRLQHFLQAEEVRHTAVANNAPDQHVSPGSIVLANGTFFWDDLRTKPALVDVDVHVTPGTCAIVTGRDGAGKSALLQALIGELETASGRLVLAGSVAYTAQIPWIRAQSVRDNILLGTPFDGAWYTQVLDACALRADISALPAGDNTPIGARGVNVPFGTRQRIALARAVYRRAAIYLLDDPLFGLDGVTARHVWRHCIQGLLADRTRLIVTREQSVLAQSDVIFVLDGGRVVRAGSYEQLTAPDAPAAGANAEPVTPLGKSSALKSAATPRAAGGSVSFRDLLGSGHQRTSSVDRKSATTPKAARAAAAAAQAAAIAAAASGTPGGTDASVAPGDEAMGLAGPGTAALGTLDDDDGGDDDLTGAVATETHARAGGMDDGTGAAADAAAVAADSDDDEKHAALSGARGGRYAPVPSRPPPPRVGGANARQPLLEGAVGGAAGATHASSQSLAASQRSVALSNSGAVAGGGLYDDAGADEHRVYEMPWIVYGAYVRTAGGVLVAVGIVFFMAVNMSANVATNRFLAYWSDEADPDHTFYILMYVTCSLGSVACLAVSMWALMAGGLRAARTMHAGLLAAVLRVPIAFYEQHTHQHKHAGGAGAAASATISASTVTAAGGTTVRSVAAAGAGAGPAGSSSNGSGGGSSGAGVTRRILSRFSHDMHTIDEKLSYTFNSFLSTAFSILGVFLVVSYVTPYFVPVFVPLSFMYWYTQKYFIRTSRELTRLDVLSRAPLYTHFAETLDGLSSIRAYRLQQAFVRENELKLDANLRAYYPTQVANRWLALRLEFVGTIIVAAAALCVVAGRHNGIDAGLAALSLSYALTVTQSLSWLVRMSAEQQSNIVAVAHITNLSDMPGEAGSGVGGARGGDRDGAGGGGGGLIEGVVRPPQHWPQHGQIACNSLFVRYVNRPGAGAAAAAAAHAGGPVPRPYALHGVSCSVRPREKVALVGRGVGAGKATLFSALLRLVEAESGSIQIDGLDIRDIGLRELRSRLSRLPRDVVLFSGSVRFNVDPHMQHSTHDIWQVLEQCHLDVYIRSLPNALDYEITDAGAGFSPIQRQLLSLARVLLRKSKIMLWDEPVLATPTPVAVSPGSGDAAVADAAAAAAAAAASAMDDLLFDTVMESCADCTVLVSCARTSTLSRCDRVLVLADGQIVEFDSPARLLSDARSHLSAYVNAASHAASVAAAGGASGAQAALSALVASPSAGALASPQIAGGDDGSARSGSASPAALPASAGPVVPPVIGFASPPLNGADGGNSPAGTVTAVAMAAAMAGAGPLVLSGTAATGRSSSASAAASATNSGSASPADPNTAAGGAVMPASVSPAPVMASLLAAAADDDDDGTGGLSAFGSAPSAGLASPPPSNGGGAPQQS